MTTNVLDAQLHEAAAADRLEDVQRLVVSGANPYAEDAQGRTSFNRAASNGLRSLAWLTEQAFEDTQKPEDQRRWKKYGLNTPSGRYRSTLITYAAKVCSVELFCRMADAGADLAIVNDSGWTLLHCAAVMPERAAMLAAVIEAFKDRGLKNLIGALSKHEYETSYGGNKVVYGEGLTAAGLCRVRIDQDPRRPRELASYLPILDRALAG